LFIVIKPEPDNVPAENDRVPEIETPEPKLQVNPEHVNKQELAIVAPFTNVGDPEVTVIFAEFDNTKI
jgi:hypothetical protein